MKKRYWVSKIRQLNGDHEVHDESCRALPKFENRQLLGEFATCQEAVREAKKIYLTADGCKICSPTCHTR
ncbi:hypothetical protein CLV59_103111 [Chitinophaga dinghuensis]|uniref:Uncharacterized protein n=1 Tax=Chitinophaga dinghuensis TaxID=1539050 RepID=A0A327W2Y5_9BACT|nr:hypothetical protein [Chitinophaga dinghuensis]RAJ83152.1 hypothetical protein CLV59_103111 [Chitinophaga dinghuensis]